MRSPAPFTGLAAALLLPRRWAAPLEAPGTDRASPPAQDERGAKAPARQDGRPGGQFRAAGPERGPATDNPERSRDR